MTATPTIRAATADDVEALADIYVSSARHHAALDPEFYAVPDRDAVATHLQQVLSAEGAGSVIRLVAEVDGRVVGAAEIELRFPGGAGSMLAPRLAASVGVAVLEDRRGGGIGSRLMESAEDRARERGATLMMLDASAANADALRFYEDRHGYHLRGVLLTKALSPADRGPRAVGCAPMTRESEHEAPAADPHAALKDLGWREIAEIDARLEREEIDEAGWHAEMARLIVPAYLAAETPWEGSGKLGSGEDWEYARSHIAHAIDRDGSFLDVGCANGYLLECLPRWTPHVLDRSGLDIAPQLVELARRRLPDLADRLWVGNALTWEPRHRFTYIRTGLEYVPRHRRPELVERLLGWCDRLIIGVFSEEADARLTEALLRSWGHRIAGRSERANRRKPGMEYRVLWIDG
jgi:GNAT superfamily N-acetyltransferase